MYAISSSEKTRSGSNGLHRRAVPSRGGGLALDQRWFPDLVGDLGAAIDFGGNPYRPMWGTCARLAPRVRVAFCRFLGSQTENQGVRFKLRCIGLGRNAPLDSRPFVTV
jgi:hypothetical protein